MIFRKSHFILIIGDTASTLIHQKGGQTLNLWSLASPCELKNIIKPASNISILVNTSDQKIHQEQLPKLSYFDQKCWFKQLAKNSYKKEHLFGFFPFEKFPAPLTMITVERTAYLQNWLAILRSLKILILGIYSLPVEALKLTQTTLSEQARVFLITRHGRNGARHAIFYNQKLIFTRMIALKTEELDVQGLAQEIETGISTSLAYLQRMPQAAESPVHLLYFDQAEVLHYLPKTQPGIATCVYKILKPDPINFSCPRECLADLLHAQMFSKGNRPILCLNLAGFSKLSVMFTVLLKKYAACTSALFLGLILAFTFNYNKLLLRQVKLPHVEISSKQRPRILKPAKLVKNSSRLKYAPSLHLKAVIYSSAQQWALWLNDKWITPLLLDPDVIIHKVTANQIICTWHQETQVWENIILQFNTCFDTKGKNVLKSDRPH